MDDEFKFLIVLIRVSDKLSKLIFKSEYMNINEEMINMVMDNIINNLSEFILKDDRIKKAVSSIKTFLLKNIVIRHNCILICISIYDYINNW